MRENTAAIRQLFREQVNWRKSFSHQWQEKGKSVSASAVALNTTLLTSDLVFGTLQYLTKNKQTNKQNINNLIIIVMIEKIILVR